MIETSNCNLRFLLEQISRLDDVADVDLKLISKEDLQRVWNIRVAIIESAPDHQDLLAYFRQKTKTELHIQVFTMILILLYMYQKN